jgi:2-dehydro-3-deoxyphosphogluconate aldolase / (4S)-4-hydroxy-2-oxoglutarate aldolase
MIPREMVALMERRRLVAEVRTASAIQALGVVDALAAGGVTTVEVSLTIPGAQEILTHLAPRRDVLVGAGAVLDPRQATEAISCGARFIASPICAQELIPVCRDANVACVLGALTPTEIITAQRAGAEMVKLFPAEAIGGAAYVRALFRQLSFLSLQISGGFTPENMVEYLALPIKTLALGSLLVPRALVEHGNWQAITMRARAFVEYVANPHVNAARFLAMMGVAPRPQVPQGAGMDPKAVVAAVPTINIPPGAAAAVAAASGAINGGQGSQPSANADPNASSGGFRPWDSRPVEMGDDEDWLR